MSSTAQPASEDDTRAHGMRSGSVGNGCVAECSSEVSAWASGRCESGCRGGAWTASRTRKHRTITGAVRACISSGSQAAHAARCITSIWSRFIPATDTVR